jgi:hypothetical protein
MHATVAKLDWRHDTHDVLGVMTDDWCPLMADGAGQVVSSEITYNSFIRHAGTDCSRFSQDWIQ